MTVTQKSIDQLSIDTIRTLAIDAIEKAIPATRACQWVPLRWDTNCSQKG